MTFIPILLLIIGAALLYAGIKGQSPLQVIKGVLSNGG